MPQSPQFFTIHDDADDAEESDLEGLLQTGSMEIDDFPEPQVEHVKKPSIYGTFKARLKEDGDGPEVWLNHAVKLLSCIAVCGLLMSHLVNPQYLPYQADSSRAISPVVSTAMTPTISSSAGHCMDLEPATCASWFRPNGGYDSTAMCATDLSRSNPICSRSCGSCAVLLAGCRKLKTVDIGHQCKVGEDVVGEVCKNDDKAGESYCTYLPPPVDGATATYACSVCQDSLTEISPERQVILSQMKELRDEEISREDEKLMKQTQRHVETTKLGDLLLGR